MILIEEGGSHNTEAIKKYCIKKGIIYDTFHRKHINRGRYDIILLHLDLVVGDVRSVHEFLKRLGIDPPEVPTYPVELNHLLNRKIKEMSLGDFATNYQDGLEYFIKPKELKNFTGKIISACYQIPNRSKHTQIYVSEVVEFLSEYRVFVINGERAGYNLYEGGILHKLDLEVVDEAIKILKDSGNYPENYCIDFGVMKDFSTSLVEMNEGYSFGHYGFNIEKYFELLYNRWKEIIRKSLTK